MNKNLKIIKGSDYYVKIMNQLIISWKIRLFALNIE